MGYIPNMVLRKQAVQRLRVRKRGGEKQAARAGRVASAAISIKRSYFAMRYNGTWHVYPVSGPTPLLTGVTEAAAEMWLRHREKD